MAENHQENPCDKHGKKTFGKAHTCEKSGEKTVGKHRVRSIMYYCTIAPCCASSTAGTMRRIMRIFMRILILIVAN